MVDVIVPVESVVAVWPEISVKSTPLLVDICHCIELAGNVTVPVFNVNVADPVLQSALLVDAIVADVGNTETDATAVPTQTDVLLDALTV